jgi:hypothetical protein
MSAQAMTERFEMRLGTSVLEDVDAWRASQNDVPSRAEAMRRLIEAGLLATSSGEKKQVKLADGDKLILLMLRDLYKHLKLKDGEIDPDFLAEVIFGGHGWGLEWQYSGIFHGHEDAKAVVSEVVEILDTWSFLESGYQELSKKDKARVAVEADPIGKHVVFDGFDGNEESEHIGVARFLIEQLGRFTRFKGRELNAHMPTIDAYRRMVAVFEPIRRTLTGRNLTADEIIVILKAWLHPSRRKDAAKDDAGAVIGDDNPAS